MIRKWSRVPFGKKCSVICGRKSLQLVLVLISWLIITAKQGGLLTVTAPIKFHSLPDGLVFIRSAPEEVEVQAKIFSNLIPSPKQLEIVADVDLLKAQGGKQYGDDK